MSAPIWLPKKWIHRLRIEHLEDRCLLASFRGLGNLPGGTFYSIANAVSADGSTVVGESDGGQFLAFRWTETQGMKSLGDLQGGDTRSSALAVSRDGSVIVGQSSSTTISTEAFRWSDGIMEGLGDLPGGLNSSTAYGVSASGGTIVGNSWSANGTSEAFRHAGGGLLGLSDLMGGSFFSHARGTSADGAVIVGLVSTASGGRAGRWSNGEWESLGILPESNFGASEALAISGDGSTTVGLNRGSRTEAFRVVGDSAMAGLGDLDGGDFYSVAKAVSHDGSVVVGHSATGSVLDEEFTAFVWTKNEGMRSIRTLLVEAGVDMTGWRLTSANGISADGSVIVGQGINANGRTEAWRAVLGGGPSIFTNTDKLDTLSVDLVGNAPSEIAFYVSVDGAFDKAQDEQLLSIALSPDSIAASELLIDLIDIPGGKRLRLNPAGADGMALKAALENKDIATIFAVADPALDRPGSTPFRGFYQAAASTAAVLRTGPDSKDTVAISMNSLTFKAVSASNVQIASKSTSRGLIDNLLIVTGELNDVITAETTQQLKLQIKSGSGDDEIDSGGGDDDIDGGEGTDIYWFRSSASGHDRIRDTGTEISDRLDFSLFPRGVSISLDESSQQQVAPELKLTLLNPELIENVTGSNFDDLIRGNEKVNRLIGLRGDDVLVGEGGGSAAQSEGDEIFGNEGDDVLLGDSFNLSAAAWDGLYRDFEKFIAGGTLGFSVSLSPTGSGGDTIDGGADDDLIIGGNGNDWITAGSGKALIFGDAFAISVTGELSFAFNFKDALSTLSLTQPLFGLDAEAKLVGNGRDTITGGEIFNVIAGGDGDDIIHGGKGVDVLLGNKGQDTIRGSDGLNFIAGGAGADKLLQGGANVNLILGDSLRFDVGLAIDPSAMAVKNLESVTDFLFGVTLDGASDDDDVIQGGTGSNVILGGPGNDTIDGGNSGNLDFLFGNDGRDTIRGHAGPNVIVGGSNSGNEFEVIEGGEDFNIILGDDYTLASGLNVALEKLLTGLPPLPSDFIPKVTLQGAGKDRITLSGKSTNIVLAGAGDDEVTGSDGPIEFLFGNDGSDTIKGNGGVDVIFGGAGGDALLDGGADSNVIFGDSIEIKFGLDFDFDSLFTASPVFSVTAGLKLLDSGADYIKGGPDFDFLVGGDGGDVIDGGNGLNIAFGDRFEVGGPLGTLYEFGSILAKTGEPLTAATIVIVKGLVDYVFDFFKGSEGEEGDQNDKYFGGQGTDIVFGGGGPDHLQGRGGFDFLVGGDGDDTVDAGKSSIGDGVEFGIGGEGDDIIWGSDGVDLLYSTTGSDWLFGRNGDDFIYGGDGDDELYGGDGNDALSGEGGDDLLYGGEGDDRLQGDAGNDLFYRSNGNDQVDYVSGEKLLQPGDLDQDGDVDSSDLLSFLADWTGALEPGTGTADFRDGDLDADGDIDSSDMLAFLESWTGSQAADLQRRLSTSVVEAESEHQFSTLPVEVPSESTSPRGIDEVFEQLI